MNIKREKPDTPMPEERTFGARLRYLMTIHGDTQERLAEELGVRRRTIYNWIHKKDHHVYASNLTRVSKYYGVSIDFLMGIDNEMRANI